MGCGGGKHLTEEQKRIEADIRKENAEKHQVVKIILLGPGESGKSTVFKQMKILQDSGGFDTKELSVYIPIVRDNAWNQMRAILRAAVEHKLHFQNKESLALAGSFMQTQPTDEQIAPMIKGLWDDRGVQQVFAKRGIKYQINDTAPYFFENIDRIMQPAYIPTVEDILRVRVRSNGVTEASFMFDRRKFLVVDVGGQRAERRKWIHCFDAVTTVLFCISLADYDMALREDPNQNRMRESILLFSEVANSRIFHNKDIIFFLNKTDLLAHKLKYSKLNAVFPAYNGNTPAEAQEFIKQRFLERVLPENRGLDTIYSHYTCALDTKMINVVVNSAKKTILDKLLNSLEL